MTAARGNAVFAETIREPQPNASRKRQRPNHPPNETSNTQTIARGNKQEAKHEATVFQIDTSAEVLSARARRFSRESNEVIPPVPKKRVAWSGGKMNSNKEDALQKFLARQATPGKPGASKTLSSEKRDAVVRMLAARAKNN
jgi:hypothetical protein